VVRDGAASGAEVLQVRGAEWLAAARALSSRCGLVVHQQQRRQQLAGCTMPAPKPKAWGWKVIKYYHLKGLTDPNEIVRHMRGKGMRVGRTWVQDRLRKYREDGDPNSRDARTDARRATTPERRWLKRTLQNDCALLFDQLRRKFHRRFKWWISKHMISAALKTAGPVSPGDQLDRPLSLKKIERIAKQRNEVKRRRFRRASRRLRAEQIIWIDESSAADRSLQTRMGWAPVGEPAKLVENLRTDGKLHSLLAAAIYK
jgi:hypothetical protein